MVASIRSETLLVRTALESERSTLSMDQAVYTAGHPEDVALARPMLELRAANIAELEAFLSGAKPQAAEPSRGSWLAFRDFRDGDRPRALLGTNAPPVKRPVPMRFISRIRFSLATIMMFVLAAATASALYAKILQRAACDRRARLVFRRPDSFSAWPSS